MSKWCQKRVSCLAWQCCSFLFWHQVLYTWPLLQCSGYRLVMLAVLANSWWFGHRDNVCTYAVCMPGDASANRQSMHTICATKIEVCYKLYWHWGGVGSSFWLIGVCLVSFRISRTKHLYLFWTYSGIEILKTKYCEISILRTSRDRGTFISLKGCYSKSSKINHQFF